MGLTARANDCNLRGMARLAHGDAAGAAAEFDEAICMTPTGEAALLYYNRGTARHLRGDLDGAIADFDQVLAITPGFGEALNNRGLSRQLLGQHALAIDDSDRTIALQPGYTEAHNNRGMARRSLGDPAGALADFDRAIALNPDYAQAYNNRGVLRQARGELADALADFDRAIALPPNYAEAYSNRGTARHDLALRAHAAPPLGVFTDRRTVPPARHDLADAIADFDHAIQLAPRQASVAAYHNRGAARQAQGDLVGALADFDQALAINSQHAPTYANRGTTRKALGDLAGARADLDSAVRLAPPQDAAAAYHNRGGVRVLQGDFAGAIADYDEALRLDPNLLVARISRGNARYHHRDLKAYVDFWDALKINPGVAAREIVAMLHDDLRHDAAAVLRNCRIHLRISPQDATAYCRRGLTLLLQGNMQEAKQDLDRALELWPQSKAELPLLIEEAQRRATR